MTATRKVNRRPNTTCDQCQRPIYRRRLTLEINRGKHCSRACRNRAYPLKGNRPPAAGLRGPANYAWKGGATYFRKHGNYKPIKYVRCPMEFLAMARKDGYVMEHRLIMARWIGRPLTRTEVVHHENHDPQTNEQSNLQLWPDNRSHKMWEYGLAPPAGSCVTILGRDIRRAL